MEKELKLETNNTYNRVAHPRTGPLSTGEGGGGEALIPFFQSPQGTFVNCDTDISRNRHDHLSY